MRSNTTGRLCALGGFEPYHGRRGGWRGGEIYAGPAMVAPFLAYLPSPSANGLSIGPLRLHVYGLLIAVSIAAAIWLSQRRWEQIGGAPGIMPTIAIWGVPGGLIGARVYSLATNGGGHRGHWYRAFEGLARGLGIWERRRRRRAGGYLGARRHHLPPRPLLDCVAPAFAWPRRSGR